MIYCVVSWLPRSFRQCSHSCLAAFGGILFTLVPHVCADEALVLLPKRSPEVVRLQQEVASDQLLRLEASDDLTRWTEIGRGSGGLIAYPDWQSRTAGQRFYRSLRRPLTSDDDWKNQARFEDDSFLSAATWSTIPEARWIKFAIVLAETNKVYFQDSAKYAFHYDFAVRRLPDFANLSRAQFDAQSLRTNGQRVVLGALLFPPGGAFRELGVQFVGLEPYAKEQLIGWLDLVKSVLALPPDVAVRYIPVYEQTAAAWANRAYLEERGYPLGSVARWYTADQVYAPGWSLGRMVYVPAGEIVQAYTDGRLKVTDILLTDAIPAEIPPVAGIVTLAPATPNSHVAILAKSLGVPFVYFAEEEESQRLLALTNQTVALRAENRYSSSVAQVRAVDVPDVLREAILALKVPGAVAIVPKATAGKISLSTETLGPTDIRYVGGKAAHYGLLRRAIPSNCAPAIALTFDLWDSFRGQTLRTGKTLGQTVRERLAAYTYPPDMGRLRTDLSEVRKLFTDEADFSAGDKQAVQSALSGLDPNRPIRFRSSTNVEDSDSFSGAGLYDSYSGCLADNLDGDDDGPCACDPAEPRERGVFRALKKVYASFYNDNAFLERLRHGIDEDQVGMAVLVHPSTPDEVELANGVATFTTDRSFGADQRSYQLTLVSQPGAASVANPEPSSRPETVTGGGSGGYPPFLDVQQHSGLVPLGGTAMNWPADYQALVVLLDRACRGYEAVYPERKSFYLDLEYKKVAPGALMVKQIRPIPRPDASRSIPTILLDSGRAFGVLQGEQGDLFANHRLKSRWLPRARAQALTSTNECFIESLSAEYLESAESRRFDGPITQLPGFTYRTQTDALSRSECRVEWTWGEGAAARACELTVALPNQVGADENPLLFLEDGAITWRVRYSTPQPTYTWEGPGQTLTDEVRLTPLTAPGSGSLLQQRQYTASELTVTTEFYWPPPPKGPTAGYTAPVQAWVQTVIEGLVSQPIRLVSEVAQTYHAGHHNFSEAYLFDPSLEPGLSEEIRAELSAKNIRALAIYANLDATPQFYAWGFDNQLRLLATGGKGGK